MVVALYPITRPRRCKHGPCKIIRAGRADIPVKDSEHRRPHLQRSRTSDSRFCRGCLKKRNRQPSGAEGEKRQVIRAKDF